MTTQTLTQAQAALTAGRKVCVINLAAFSMVVGYVTNLQDDTGGLRLGLTTDRGDQTTFELENSVNTVITDTGYRFESERLVLQVDFMPEQEN